LRVFARWRDGLRVVDARGVVRPPLRLLLLLWHVLFLIN
jgi:hypothetical protein